MCERGWMWRWVVLWTAAGTAWGQGVSPPPPPGLSPAAPASQAAASATAESGRSPQAATLQFFGPVTLAYLAACGAWLLAFAGRRSWPTTPDFQTQSPWGDAGLALLTAVAIFAVGRMYDAGWLLPQPRGWVGHVVFNLNTLLIFSPLALVLWWRRQGLATVWCAPQGALLKIGSGLALSIVAVAVYLAARGELGRWHEIVVGAGSVRSLSHFLPVLLEGVGLAFLFVRLQRVLGLWPAVLIPCLAFAAFHIPRQLEGGRGGGEIAAFFVLNTLLPAAILLTASRSRDVLWLAIVHYWMDVAIRAFD